MHYVDEGPLDGPVVLMLHGQPTWGWGGPTFAYTRLDETFWSPAGPLSAVGRTGLLLLASEASSATGLGC